MLASIIDAIVNTVQMAAMFTCGKKGILCFLLVQFFNTRRSVSMENENSTSSTRPRRSKAAYAREEEVDEGYEPVTKRTRLSSRVQSQDSRLSSGRLEGICV